MTKIVLRPPLESDLPILFQQQRDPEAAALSAYPSKERGEFMRHWEGILKDRRIVVRTILYKEKIVGHILSWREGKYEQRVGYWIGKEFWRRGIASAALGEFLALVHARPLYAEVASHNLASQRVLKKNGFERLDGDGKLWKYRLVNSADSESKD